jgi:FAD/FMN-containing dehydrogenase
MLVNDVHSKLNATRVRRIELPRSTEAVVEIVREARGRGERLSVAGGRHAMGGQQFATGQVLVDCSALAEVTALDDAAGTAEVGAGITWPALIEQLERRQPGVVRPWTIVQKQTGADRLSVGGALAANAHGRGLAFRPLVQDVEAFTLVDARGAVRRCSRTENAETFRLAVGGYGLLGVVTSVRLRLAPRRKVERVVELIDAGSLRERFDERIAAGFTYGDFQFAIDPHSDALLRRGVFACYRPVADDVPMPAAARELSEHDWLGLIRLDHSDRSAAFERYAAYYLSTSGQTYWSDRHQLATYVDDYHAKLAAHLPHLAGGSEMISELYVPRAALASFLEAARCYVRERAMQLVYGTIRLIERDDETVLAWAREPWACVVVNLHTEHDPTALEKTSTDFRRLIDRALEVGGSYFLTYHRWATRAQVLRAHPRLPEFLASKRRHDPDGLFASDWHRHHVALLEG